MGLNEYTREFRGNKYKAAKAKYYEELRVMYSANLLKNLNLKRVIIKINWYEANKKRDLDNISFAKKFILDGLQQIKVLENDGWKQIAGFEDKFFIDAKNPRVEVIIEEVL